MTVNVIRFVCLSILLFKLTVPCPGQCQEHSADLFDRLKAINGVYVKRIEALPGFIEGFELAFVQPLDHGNPKGARFTQRVFLSHRDFSKPVVLETEGYGVSWPKEREMARILDANQVIVEHRYYESSKPNPVKWEYLTSWQAASDLHLVVETLKAIYPGKWISCGRSKGGMAALFHRANYPHDVDATVAWVAPIMLGPIDPRFESFMSSIGDEPTREKTKQFQRTCLARRSELLPMLKELSMNQKLSFALGLDEVFEWAIIQFPFSFWSGDRRGSDIPQPDAPKEQLFGLLSGSFTRFTERQMTYNAALYYQQFTELGYHGYPVAHMVDLLQWVKDPNFSIYVPKDARNATFRKDVMPTILNYLQNEGNNILYLYGEYDMWTSCAVELTGNTNAVKLIARDKGHVFSIVDFGLPEKEQIYTALEDWLGIEIRR
ncbi:MAG TPA: S28 family serine protease [Acidobacteriota bacterium]|nr:S28 family serine protease [Acidobacteriota bacterium]